MCQTNDFLKTLEAWEPAINAFNVLATLLLGFAVAWMAREQNRLSKLQARLAVYDRCITLHDAIRRFIASIQQTGDTDINKLGELLRETRHAKYLFPRDPEITKLIKELYDNGLELEYSAKAIQSAANQASQEAQRVQLIKEQSRLLKWFSAQHEKVEKLFLPHLGVDV